jgi:hypothetical protein
MKALRKKPQRPDEMVDLRDEQLIGISMSDAAALFGVSNTVIAPRTRLSRPRIESPENVLHQPIPQKTKKELPIIEGSPLWPDV